MIIKFLSFKFFSFVNLWIVILALFCFKNFIYRLCISIVVMHENLSNENVELYVHV